MQTQCSIAASASELAARRGALLLGLCLLLCVRAVAQNWGTPVWSDEFSGPLGTPIDPSKWTYDTGILNVNNEVEYYCAPSTLTGGCQTTNPNAYIDGSGNLVIQAIRLNTSTQPNSGSWTSARLITNGLQAFQYGRVESRMSLPVGPGIWPAFWALGSNISSVGWPVCGEIDYMENVPASGGLGPTAISSTLHGNSPSGVYGLGRQYTFPSGDVTGMHAYGAIWSPGMVQFYVDDPAKVFFAQTASDMTKGQVWAFDHPFFLLLNLAIGGDGSWPGPADATTPSPALMTVDYVRIYKAAAVPAPNLGAPPGITVKAGATTGNSTTLNIGESAGSGRVFLTCSTSASLASCAVKTNDALNSNTLDFASSSAGSATVIVTTAANSLLLPRGFGWNWTKGLGLTLLLLVLVTLWLPRLLSMRAGRRVLQLASVVALVFVPLLLGCGGSTGGNSGGGSSGGGTTPGSYSITVNAYTVSGSGNSADATIQIPLTVN